MTMNELAAQYRQSARLILVRIKLLEAKDTQDMSELEKLSLKDRIDTLWSIYRETMKTARYLEDYYREA